MDLCCFKCVRIKYLNNEPHEDLGRDLEAMEQSPEDAGYLPLNTTTEEGESLSQLFEYTLPDWALNNDDHLIEDEARASAYGT